MNVKHTLRKNSNNILIGLGIAGMGCAIFMAIKAKPEADEAIDEKKKELKKKKLTPSETFKATWKVYTPTVLTFAAATSCIVSGTYIGNKKTKAAAAACSLANTTFHEYRAAVADHIGEKNEKKILRDMDESAPAPQNVTVVMNGDLMLYRDAEFGSEFLSNPAKIADAKLEYNTILCEEGCASLNQWYELLGVNYTDIGELLGFRKQQGVKFDLILGDPIMKDGKAYIQMRYSMAPVMDYDMPY